MTNTPSPHASAPGQPSWFERNVRLIIIGLVVACVLSLVAEVIWHGTFFDEKHPAHFELENTYFYSAGLGFLAFIAVVFLGKLLRPVIKRPEDYYDQ